MNINCIVIVIFCSLFFSDLSAQILLPFEYLIKYDSSHKIVEVNVLYKRTFINDTAITLFFREYEYNQYKKTGYLDLDIMRYQDVSYKIIMLNNDTITPFRMHGRDAIGKRKKVKFKMKKNQYLNYVQYIYMNSILYETNLYHKEHNSALSANKILIDIKYYYNLKEGGFIQKKFIIPLSIVPINR